jgi:hypothetical protein
VEFEYNVLDSVRFQHDQRALEVVEQ